MYCEILRKTPEPLLNSLFSINFTNMLVSPKFMFLMFSGLKYYNWLFIRTFHSLKYKSHIFQGPDFSGSRSCFRGSQTIVVLDQDIILGYSSKFSSNLLYVPLKRWWKFQENIPEAFSEPSKTSKMEFSAKNVNGLKSNYFCKKLHLRFLSKFWIRFCMSQINS